MGEAIAALPRRDQRRRTEVYRSIAKDGVPLQPPNDPRPSGTLLPLALFTTAYMGAAVALSWTAGNREFLFYIVVMVVLIAAVMGIRRRAGLSQAVLWCLTIWGLLHMAGGLVPVPEDWAIAGDIRVLYSWWIIPGALKYDQVIHAYGFGVTTWVCWQGLQRATGVARPTLGLMVLSAAAGMGFGALNEIVEFGATLLVPETNVGGYVNTGWDLVANWVGSCGAAATIWLHGRKGQRQS